MHARVFAFLLALFGLTAAPCAFALSCELLPTVHVESARVTAALWVPGPSFIAPDGATYTNLPSFCKVSVVATPTPDSLINIEVWLPQNWNQRLEGIGNGGYAGTIAASVPAMTVALRRQFAVVATDLGTAPSANNNGDVLVGHPQKWEDFGHRATHLMRSSPSSSCRRSTAIRPPTPISTAARRAGNRRW